MSAFDPVEALLEAPDRAWLAQRVESLTWLDSDLPIDGAPSEALSATGGVGFEIPGDIAGMIAHDGRRVFDKWGTMLYLEEDERIRWGGLVIDLGEDGENVSLECGTFMSYLYGQAWTGEISRVNADPADIIREILAHVQSFPDGNLNIEVVGSTTKRVGTETAEEQVLDADGTPVTDADGEPVMRTVPVPYEFNWWDNGDCGAEIDRLASEAGFEWVEEHEWVDRSAGTIRHVLRIADRIGGRRDDLTFEEGVNITEVPSFDEDGDEYASEVQMLGAGEGKESLRAVAAVRVTNRLRRARVIDTTKDVRSKARLDSLARLEVLVRAGAMTTDRIEVEEHPHAPIGSWKVGDEVPVTTYNAMGDPVTRWYRIESQEMLTASTAGLDLLPTY